MTRWLLLALLAYGKFWLPKPLVEDFLEGISPKTPFSWGHVEIVIKTPRHQHTLLLSTGYGQILWSQYIQPEEAAYLWIKPTGAEKFRKVLFWPATQEKCLEYYDITNTINSRSTPQTGLYFKPHTGQFDGYWLFLYLKDQTPFVALWQSYWHSQKRLCWPTFKMQSN